MHHHGLLLLAMGVDVERAKALRQIEVDLRRAALPVAPDCIAQHIFELRPVERAFARIDPGLDAPARSRLDLFEHGPQYVLGVIPHRVGADALLRPGRELDHDVFDETEIFIDREDQVVDLETFIGELRFGAEHMCVVLCEAAHAHQAVHGARRLIAVHDAEFGEAQRQVAIAF